MLYKYALLILYKRMLGRDLAWLDGMVRAKRPVRRAQSA